MESFCITENKPTVNGIAECWSTGVPVKLAIGGTLN